MAAALLVPTAGQCLQIGGPIVLVLGTIWFWRNGDLLLERLFPNWEWERQLGWLNLRANRQADRILRALTHLLHGALLIALIGILALSSFLGRPLDTDSAITLFSIFGVWVYLIACYGFWIYYFAAILAPRVRDEYEAAELARYRRENPEVDDLPSPAERLNVTVWDSSRPRRF
jgi:hypothetical protein